MIDFALKPFIILKRIKEEMSHFRKCLFKVGF